MVVALLIAALVCFLLAFLTPYGGAAPWARTQFGWLGAAFITVTLLLPALH